MVDEKKLFSLIDNLRNNFDKNNVEDYTKAIFIVYNSMFLDNEVPMSTKYKIFSLLDHILYSENYPEVCEEDAVHEDKCKCEINEVRSDGKCVGDFIIYDELHKRNGKSANWDTIWDDVLSWRLRQDELYSFTMSDEGE